MMMGIEGVTLGKRERDFIQSQGIGGILLFSRNFHTPKALVELVASLQGAAGESPLLIAVDQEGGPIMRFKAPFTPWPAMGDLSSLDSPDLCSRALKMLALELTSCGVNLNLAPVCDIVTPGNPGAIGDRAFGGSEAQVSRFVPAAVEGLHAGGILCCAKHFPGHGPTTEDSHVTLPRIEKAMEDLKAQDFVPFARAVEAGVDLVMMAHLLVPAIDPTRPTALSPRAYEMLRRDLAFEGPVITDDMQMGAVTGFVGPGEAAVMALEAGADIVEYRDGREAERAYGAIVKALESGRLKEKALEEKISRVKTLKEQMLLPRKYPSPEEAERFVGAKEHRRFLLELREHMALGRTHK